MELLKTIFSVFPILLLVLFSRAQKNSDSLNSNQTSVNPDIYLTTPKVIRRHGYRSESHKIQSEDGYLIGYHRILHGRTSNSIKKPYPVILHHGLLSSSFEWIVNGPKKSLAYRLADEGYDVWLANARGSTDSKAHISLKPAQKEFWNFSFHEMGKYDIPAAINYILNSTNSEKLIYIGHSQGTTIFYVFATTRPEMSDKVLVHISLAPVAMIPHTTSLFRSFVPLVKQVQLREEWQRIGSFLEYSPMMASVTKLLCGQNTTMRYTLCDQLIFLIAGRDDEQFQKEVFTMMSYKLPSGTSVKNMLHSAQLIDPGLFTQFDYGKKENMKIYNQTTPSKYDFRKLRIPVRLYYGNNDLISNSQDAQNLYKKLSKPLGCIRIPFEKWNHVDFLWAKDVNQFLNEELLQFLHNANENENFIEKSVAKAIDERNKVPTLP